MCKLLFYAGDLEFMEHKQYPVLEEVFVTFFSNNSQMVYSQTQNFCPIKSTQGLMVATELSSCSNFSHLNHFQFYSLKRSENTNYRPDKNSKKYPV